MTPSGEAPGRAALNVAISRTAYERTPLGRTTGGRAYGDIVGFRIELRNRQSFSADRPDRPDVFRHGETADAEPAAPGSRFVVNELFD